jgi:magnesium chelatase subunit D
VVIEGPPGTGKSTLLRDIAADLGREVVFAEGNAELTPARLVGQYDPAQVLTGGYVPASFTDGPLLQAMRAGSLLYLEEFNRVPEETLNVLITVLAEGEIAVPRLGLVRADPGFRLIAAMNPFDAIGTARVSQAIADRICRVVLGYQDAVAERQITTALTGQNGQVVDFAVMLTRATREHRDVRMGSSVRGAIDLVLLVTGLGVLRREPGLVRDTATDAAHAALSGRIRLADGCDRTPESVVDELLGEIWPADEPAPRPSDEAEATDPDSPDGQGKADGPSPLAAGRNSRSSLRRDRRGGQSRRSTSRAELAARHPGFADVSPDVGELDPNALEALLAADPDAAAALLADLALATDRQLREAARRLAARVFVRLAATGGRPAKGTRRLAPAHRADGDLDLELTIERRTGGWPPGADELVTRTWRADRRAVCLLVDSSGSMSGQSLAIAAVTAASVVLAESKHMDTAVLSFGGQVSVLQQHGQRRAADQLVGDLLALRGHGLTDLAAALRAGARQLAAARADQRIVLLLSDCLHTTGADPAASLAGIDRLHVLCPLPTAESAAAASGLARAGGGLSLPVRRLGEIPSAVTRLLAAR